MMNRLLRFFDDRRVFLGAAGLWVLSSFYIYTAGPFQQLSQQSDGFVFFDMHCDYSIEQAVQSLASTDEDTRRLYIKHLVLDTLFAMIQSLAVISLLLFAVRKCCGASSKLQWIGLPVLLIALVDVTENVGIFLMLTSHSGNTSVLIELTRSITALKFALSFFLPASLILAVGMLLWSAIMHRRLNRERPSVSATI